MPINGERKLKQPYSLANIEYYPGTNIKIPGGQRLLHVHTKYYKDALHRKLSIAPADPGAWHMNAECSAEWAKQMCAEYVDDLGNWTCPKGRDNHAWDVSVYGFCLAGFLGLRYQTPELYETEPDEPMSTAPRRNAHGDDGSGFRMFCEKSVQSGVRLHFQRAVFGGPALGNSLMRGTAERHPANFRKRHKRLSIMSCQARQTSLS